MQNEDKYWARFQTKFHGDPDSDCWLWTGSIEGRGYGQFWNGEKLVMAHRYIYEHEVGKIAPGLVIDHKCHTKRCVNPAHLRALTHAENHQNRKGARSDSRSGYLGVSWHGLTGKWQAGVMFEGKRHHLGLYATPEEARDVAAAGRRRYFKYNDLDRQENT